MVSSTTASIDSASPRPEFKEPWLPEPEELPTTPWYEEKSSNLKLSDIANIKEKGGTMGKFEVVLPHPDERAHRPPPGFHTFYMNQIERGLRFPIPRFIAALCHHIKISPSQLDPNSYSFLLALAVLFCYHDLPLIPYVLMQLIQIKRLGPGKFYISHKGDHTFIKGNPSSHKGLMSRFFYIKCDSMRDPWRCEMQWRDNVFTLTPRTPDRTPSLTPFLETMRGKSYNAPELIKEDLLCFFKFSRKGIELVGDLDERMGRAELLRAMQEEARASREVGPPKKAKKRKAPSSTEAEVHRERRKKSASSSGALPEETQEWSRAQTPLTAMPEETPDPTSVVTILEASSSRRRSGRPTLFDPSKDSLVASPTAVVATRYICNMAPDPDLQIPMKAELGPYCPGHESARRGGGEARGIGGPSSSGARGGEDPAGVAGVELAAEKEARAIERDAMVAELEKANAWPGQEAERLKSEAREEFLKSSEFDSLLAKKAWSYFKDGFWGCLAQFRAHGYFEEEYPAFFLDLQQALADVGDEDEVEEEEEQEEGEGGSDAKDDPPNSPQS
ncbi:hypothetical protein F511_30876 [Dorcoceras hygrometricum]|uniref:Uncharacterized protein n=1 Tax=Dorcoceras hygrometricum TaxID=472368 RepID=A0A2Z7ACE3_9LAMI|nr:hypothetical protein F511_30876 [Dorcoceras hygrometricum]